MKAKHWLAVLSSQPGALACLSVDGAAAAESWCVAYARVRMYAHCLLYL